MKSLQLQVQQQSAITGFCYAFAKLLLDRLNKLLLDDKLYEVHENHGPRVVPLGENLLNYLNQQIPKTDWYSLSHIPYNREFWLKEEKLRVEQKEKAKQIIADAYEFLSTFEKK